jgi:hypothetical protein
MTRRSEMTKPMAYRMSEALNTVMMSLEYQPDSVTE